MIVMAVGILVGIDITLLIIASVVPQLRIYAEVQTGSEYPSIDSGVSPLIHCKSFHMLSKLIKILWSSVF